MEIVDLRSFFLNIAATKTLPSIMIRVRLKLKASFICHNLYNPRQPKHKDNDCCLMSFASLQLRTFKEPTHCLQGVLGPMISRKPQFILVKMLVVHTLFQLGGCSSLSIDTETAQISADQSTFDLNTATTIVHEKSVTQTITESTEADLWHRVRNGFEFIPSQLPNAVIKQQKQYLKNTKLLDNFFTRAEPYLFYVVEQLAEAGLPLELALLPIVESAYDPFAYSHSHAVGLWQFIPSTGKSLGLHRDRWYEGRRDVVKSTQAAVSYLNYLNRRFNGDWLHTLAAYNSGEGTVKKAIKKNKRRGKGTDFWSLKLPRETRNYVPRLLALVNIVKNPKAYKVELPNISNAAFFETVSLQSQIELAKIIEVTGVDEALFINLNAAYRRSVTPPKGEYQILLPIADSENLKSFLANNHPSTWAPYREYVVKSGDTLSHIAQRYQIPTTLIKDHNGLKRDFLRVGQVLRIPPTGERATTEYKTLRTISYKVAVGDTLSEIAEKYKTSIRSIKHANGLTNNTIKVGQTLSINTPSSTGKPHRLRKLNYRVRRGDSLYLIAKRFDLTIGDITRWNRLERSNYLQPGQRLTLYINPLRI